MTDRHTLRWCPGCSARAVTAPMPQLTEDAQLSQTVRAGDPTEGFARKNYCTACGQIWASVELPQTFVAGLLKLEEELEEQRRQVAMLKFLLANERKTKTEGARPAAEESPGRLKVASRRNAA